MNEVPIQTPYPPVVEQAVNQARADLAKRLGVDPSQVEVVGVSSVTWPDASLGCPQPGMVYTQVMVDGYRVRLRASGQVYEYHGSGSSRPPFLCKK